MKVLVITNAYPTKETPSLGVFIKSQIDSIRRQGIDIDLLFIKGYQSKFNYLKAILQFWCRLYARSLSRQRLDSTLNASYDLIHAHYGLSGWVARMQFKRPVVVSFMGDDILGTPAKNGRNTFFSLFLVGLNKILSRLVNGVIIKSAEMETKLGLPKAVVIPNGVDLELFKPMERVKACQQLNLDPAKQYILFANNPDIAVKNFPLAQRVFQIVQEKIKQVELVVVHKETWHKMPLYMNACDILLMTSFHEGSPNTIKEAMACNLPIVSVGVGDVKEVTRNTRNCFVTSRDARQMAEQVIQIIDSNERSNGRERITHLEIQKVAQQIIDIYQRILNSP